MSDTKPSEMKECCTVDNLKQATADGKLDCAVNVLVCKTCDHQESYAYMRPDPQNALYSWCKFAAERERKGLPLFRGGR